MFKEIFAKIMELRGAHWTYVLNMAKVLEEDIDEELACGSITPDEAMELNQELEDILSIYGQEI